MKMTSTSTKKILLLKWVGVILLSCITIGQAIAQNVFSGEPVQWVGQPNGYNTNPYNSDYRTTIYRKVSTTVSNPSDGRGQWATTVNVQNTGGDVTPFNMPGGGGVGWLLISGPGSGRFNNKWNFNGIGQAAVNAINNIVRQGGGQDMGLNMSTTGRYTFVMRDAGYANSEVYIAYTSNAPVSVSRTGQSFNPSGFTSDISISTSTSPSSGENVFVRYRSGTNDFTTGTSIVQATGTGTNWTAAIPQQTCGATVYYYVFTSTRTLGQLNGNSEQERSLSAIRYDDNSGNNYSYNVSPVPTAGITNNTGSTVLTCALTSISVTATGGQAYSWDGGLGNTAAASITAPGTYTVTVTGANGCTATSSITITQDIIAPTAVITNISGTTVLTCTQTTITLIPSGGVSQVWNVGGSGSLVVNAPGTYTVTATGVNGCTATASETITQDITTPTAGITNNSGSTVLTCALSSISVTATGGQAYSWDGGLGNSAAASITAPGTYTVTVTGTNGCTATSSITVTQDITAPTAGITNNSGSTVLTCALSSISVTATGGQAYSWTGGLGNTAAASITAPGTYTVTVTGSNGCTATSSITVTQDITAPTAGITNNSGSTVLTCALSSISVTATGGQAYSWSGGLGNSASASISAPGTYTATVTGSNGCTATSSITVTQDITTPTAGITNNSGSTVLTCALSSISVTATGGQAYSWDGGLGNNAAASITALGTYTVTVTGSNGCTATSSITVTQDITTPTAGITNNSGSTVLTCALTSISVTATGGQAYSWSGGLGNTAAASITAPGTYTVTVTGSNGCTATSSITVTQDITTPTAGITNNSGSTVLTCTLTSISVTATGGQGYSWSGGLGNNAAASITAPGTYTVTVTGSNGCTATSSITVTQDITAPSAGITNNSGSTVLTCTLTSISVTATGGQGYSWSGGLGNSAAASITAPGTYTVTVTGSNGCTATSSITVTQNLNLPAAPVVSGITNVCPFVGTGTPITYTAISANATGFTWVVPGNVNIISGQGTATLTVTFAPGFTAQANKQLRVTATNTCGSSTQVIYYLLAQLPNTPSTIVASTNNVCPSIGTLVSITYTIPKVAAATSYLWTAQAGTTTITHTNGLGVNDTTVTVLFSGAFTTSAITVRAVNDCGTSSARSLTISRNNPSTPSLISGPTMACPYISPNGTPASYSIPAVPNATSYNWTVPSGAIGLSGQGTNSISFVYPPGFTSGTVSVTASNGCGNSASRNLSISTLSPATPGVIDVVNTATCPNRQYTYTIAALPSNATTLTWTVAGGNILSGQGTTSITVSYASTAINGSISVVAGNNCGNSVARTLNVKLPACTLGRSIENASKNGFVPLTETFTINVFPNPSTSAFRIQVETGSQELVKARVLDLQGRVLQQLIVVPGKTVELGTNLKSGQYILETTQGNIIKSTRMVKL